MRNKTYHIKEEIIGFIDDYTRIHQYPPTIREIGAAVGLRSTSSVHAHVKSLIEDGRLEKDSIDGKPLSRTLRLPDSNNK